MGRGKNQRKSTRSLDSDDDTLSSTSTGALSDRTTFMVETEEEENNEDLVLETHLDSLYEKRGSTREAGLKGLIGAFANSLQLDFVENNYETLLDLFLKAMKRSYPEVALAAHALGLLSITVGAGDMAHKVLEEVVSQFSYAIKPTAGSDYITLVVQSLAIITFVGGNELEDTKKSMDILWSQFIKLNKLEATARAAAISSWSFLLTILPGQHINSKFIETHLPVLASFLQVEARAMRIAAGEAITLIFKEINSNQAWSSWKDKDLDDVDENPSPGSSFSVASIEKRVLEQMKALSIEAGGKGSTKKDLNSQKNSFREFLSSIEFGKDPVTTVKLQKGFVLSFENLTKAIQLNFLRRYLGGGFQKHMQTNTLLHEVFDFNPVAEKQPTLSATEKRLYRSPNSVLSKAKTQHLNKQRDVKNERHWM